MVSPSIDVRDVDSEQSSRENCDTVGVGWMHCKEVAIRRPSFLEESTINEQTNGEAPKQVSLGQLFRVFFYMGATSFGGGVVAYLREHLVHRQKWLNDDEFIAALEIGETVPGLISINVSVIVGNHLRGLRGAIAAIIGMTIPGAVAIAILGVLYSHFRSDPEVKALLAGVSAAAVGLIFAVTLQIGKREMTQWIDFVILIPVFLLVGVFHISLVPALVVFAPIAIWIHRPNEAELSRYHAQRAEYHSQMADHHTKRAEAAQAESKEQAAS